MRIRALDGVFTDRPLLRGAATAMFVTGGSMVSGFAVQVTLTRHLGHAGYGAYAFAFGCVNIGVILAKGDLDTVATRFGATFGSVGDWGRFRSMTRLLLSWTGALAIGLSLVALVGLLVSRPIVLASTTSVLLASLAILPPMAVAAVASAILQSVGRVFAAQFPSAILRSVLFLVILLVAGAGTTHLTPEFAAGANTVASVVALGLSLFLLGRLNPGHDATPIPRDEQVVWVKAARGALLVSLGQIVLSTQTDVVLLGVFTTKEQSGYYAVGSQLANLAVLGIFAIQTVVGPRIAALYSKGDLVGLQSLVDRVRRGSLLLTVPLLVALVAGGPWILQLYGPAFVIGSYPPLVILTLAMFTFPLMGNIGGFLLTLTGHHDDAARIVAISAGCYLALAFVLGPRYGPEGIATCTLVAYSLRSVLLYRFAKRHIGIDLLGA